MPKRLKRRLCAGLQHDVTISGDAVRYRYSESYTVSGQRIDVYVEGEATALDAYLIVGRDIADITYDGDLSISVTCNGHVERIAKRKPS